LAITWATGFVDSSTYRISNACRSDFQFLRGTVQVSGSFSADRLAGNFGLASSL
jgi:hypothetical protein